MKINIKKLKTDQSGQSLVLVALSLMVLLGVASIAVDYGYLAWQKRQIQNAADAAALAGAQSLKSESIANEMAIEYSFENGFVIDESNVETPYEGDSYKIKVTISETFPTFFGRILKINEGVITANAVAEKIPRWEGEGLPFINLTFDYSQNNELGAWTMAGEGIKGTLQDFNTVNGDTDDPYFDVKYEDGVTVTPGFSAGQKGLDSSTLKDGLKKIIKPEYENKKIFYLYSLSSKVIQEGEFTVNNDKDNPIPLDKLNQLKNNDVIDPEQLVVIQVLFNGTDNYNVPKNLSLTYTGKVYDLVTEFPTKELYTTSPSRLIR